MTDTASLIAIPHNLNDLLQGWKNRRNHMLLSYSRCGHLLQKPLSSFFLLRVLTVPQNYLLSLGGVSMPSRGLCFIVKVSLILIFFDRLTDFPD
jgi:hypothetical protein